MTSIARQIAESANWDAAAVLEMAPHRRYPGTNVDRDWDTETTEYTFTDDGSVLTVSDPAVTVEDSSLARGE